MTKRTFNSENQPRSRAVDVAKSNPALKRGRIGTYLNRDTLTIPDDIRERFKADGFHLRWVRHSLGVGGQFDVKNVGNRAMLGFIPVTIDEVPEFALFTMRRDISLPGAPGLYDFKDVVIQGDLMLAKCPIENVMDYRREVYEESKLRHDAVSRKARDDGLDINESATEYTERGRRFIPKRVSFASDDYQ